MVLAIHQAEAQFQHLALAFGERRQGVLNVKFHAESKVDPAKLMALVGATPAAQFTPAGVLRLPLDGRTAQEGILEFLKLRLAELGSS